MRIISDCKSYGFPEPDWISENKSTKLIFPGITHQISSEGVNEGVKNELMTILNLLSNKPLQKAHEIAEQLNKGVSTVERYLRILKDNGLIEFVGAPKTGGYKLK